MRDRRLNPPAWVDCVEEPVSGHPRRAVPRDDEAREKLERRTPTNLYNARPKCLADAHSPLDSAVASAYGWDPGISEEDALASLLRLNRSLAA